MTARGREEVHEMYHAPRRPQPPRRPGVLNKPEAALVSVSRGSRVVEGAPLLTPVVLVGGADHDDKTIAFLLKAALKGEEDRREEKKTKASIGSGSGMCKAGFTGDVASHDIAILVGMCKAGFAGEDAHHALSVHVASGTGMCRPGFFW